MLSCLLPMMAIHGDADEIVPDEGGKVWIAPVPFPNVPQWVASWAKRNRWPLQRLCLTNLER